MIPEEHKLIDVEELSELFVNGSILSREEELTEIVPENAKEDNWIGLEKRKVLLVIPGISKNSKQYKLWLEKAKKDGFPNLESYWNGMRIIAYSAIRKWVIIKSGDEVKKYPNFEVELNQGSFNNNDEEEDKGGDSWRSQIVDQKSLDLLDEDKKTLRKTPLGSVSFDDVADTAVESYFKGASKEDFEPFFTYVCQRMCGERPDQIKKCHKPQLEKWREDFNIGLIDFFVTRIVQSTSVGGFARDYVDMLVNKICKKTGLNPRGHIDSKIFIRRLIEIVFENDERSEISPETYPYIRLRLNNRLTIADICTTFNKKYDEVEWALRKAVVTMSNIIFEETVGENKVNYPNAEEKVRIKIMQIMSKKIFGKQWSKTECQENQSILPDEKRKHMILPKAEQDGDSKSHDLLMERSTEFCGNVFASAMYYGLSDEPITESEIDIMLNSPDQVIETPEFIDRLMLEPELFDYIVKESSSLNFDLSLQLCYNGALTDSFKRRINRIRYASGLNWKDYAKKLGVYSVSRLKNLIDCQTNAYTKKVKLLDQSLSDFEKQLENRE
jgi:hypothetical protein